MKSTHEEVAEYAKDAFKDHILIVEHESDKVSLYLCRKPGTGIYNFRVMIGPNCITIYGDIGDGMVLRPGNEEMLGWIRGSCKSTDYVISKMPHYHTKQEFSEYYARKHWEELKKDFTRDDNQEKLAKMEDCILASICEGDNGRPLDEWYQFMTEKLDDSDPYYPTEHDSSVYWTIEALKKFVQLYNQANPGIQ